MAGDVDICNAAARKLGCAEVVSLTEDTVEGRFFGSVYELKRDEELRRHVWSFSIERAQLAKDVPSPTWGRAYSYTLPAGFLRLAPKYAEDNLEKDWQIEGRKILTDDSDPLNIRYVARIVDVNRMDVLFREALACKIALEGAEKLTQSNTKKESLKDDYRFAIMEAKRINAIEKPVADDAVEDGWISCRR